MLSPPVDLASQRVPGRRDVGRPDGRAVALAPGPCRAAQDERRILAHGREPVVKRLGVAQGIEPGDLEAVAQGVARVVLLEGEEFGLAGVEPEGADAVPHVAFAHLLPEVAPRLRVGRVVEGLQQAALRLVRGVLHGMAPFVAHEHAACLHGRVARARGIDRGPDGDHELDAHGLQFPHHGARVGPQLGIEAPVAHLAPVVEVHDDGREREPPLPVLARHGQELLLRLVAKLALPETGRPVRERRGMPGHLRVPRQDLGGRAVDHHPVVDLLRRLGHPACLVPAQVDPADAGVVPQEAVPLAREEERYGGLRVPMQEVQDAALLVQVAVLPLPQAVDPLAVAGEETLLRVPGAAPRREHPAGYSAVVFTRSSRTTVPSAVRSKRSWARAVSRTVTAPFVSVDSVSPILTATSPVSGGAGRRPPGESRNPDCRVTRTRTPFLPQGTIQIRSYPFFHWRQPSTSVRNSRMAPAYRPAWYAYRRAGLNGAVCRVEQFLTQRRTRTQHRGQRGARAPRRAGRRSVQP